MYWQMRYAGAFDVCIVSSQNAGKAERRRTMEVAFNNRQVSVNRKDEVLYGKLDRAIDDMEKGRVLPLEEAFEKITEMRNTRRNARM